MKLVAIMALAALLAGCGGSGGAGSQNELAAQACDDYAKSKLEDKNYTLDHVALAASMIAREDGSNFLKGPIIVEPGRSSESTQVLECSVRFVEGKDLPDVLQLQFIW